MKKVIFILLALMLLFTGCSRRETVGTEEAKKETTEAIEEVTTEEETTEQKDIIAKGSGVGKKEETVAPQESEEEIASPTDLTPLPDVIEPEDNNSAVNPRITNASIILPGDFDKYMLFSGILTFMDNYDIKDTCTEIEMLEIYTQGTSGYKAILKFENSPEEVVAIYKYDTFFDVQKFVDNDDVGYTEDDL